MMIVNIDVPDIEAGIAFYSKGLSFELKRRLFDGSVAELGHHSGQIYLIEQRPGSTPVPGCRTQRMYDAHWTPVHIDFGVEDLDTARERAMTAGATASTDITYHDFGKLAPMRDPFGHGFCLIEFSEQGYQ